MWFSGIRDLVKESGPQEKRGLSIVFPDLGTIHPPLTLEKLLLPHASQPNNPLIAEPLFLTKYIEKAGSGTVDMINRCQKIRGQTPFNCAYSVGEFKNPISTEVVVRVSLLSALTLPPRWWPE